MDYIKSVKKQTMSIIDWVANNRIGRFVGLVVSVDTLMLPVYFISPALYIGVVLSNLVVSLYCSLTMKVH